MVIVMKPSATQDTIQALAHQLETDHPEVRVSITKGVGCSILGLVGDTSQIDQDKLTIHQDVDRVMRVQEPYKKANRKFHPEDSAVRIGNATELMSPKYCELFEEKVDMVQIGARNMQNFDLLKEVGKMSKPILLKRGLANTYEEWIMSAEYIMAAGNENVILCERGVRTFETFTRNTLDLSAIPAIRRMSHLPIVVDPSHAAGMYWMVEPLAMAAAAVGADGLMIEVHNNPACAKCDGQQSLTPEKFRRLMDKVVPLVELMGKTLT